MRILLTAIKPTGLFFIDSLTTPASKAFSLANEMGIKTARRDIFIDNQKDPAKITAQLKSLIVMAKKTGQAIGIGHPYPATLEALAGFQKNLRQEVALVGISELVREPSNPDH